MAIALSPSATFDYVLQQDQQLPSDQQTVFKLRTLDGIERHELFGVGVPLDLGRRVTRRHYELLRAGLVGWQNLRGPDGKPVEFMPELQQLLVLGRTRAPVSDECLAVLEPGWLEELATEIFERSGLTPGDRKNSQSPQP